MSLGKDFERRRLMAAAGDSGYVWDVYAIEMDVQWGRAPINVTRRATYTKMASGSYTINNAGLFTLTNPTSTPISGLGVVGTSDYVVDIANSNSSVTSGTALYNILSVSSSGTNRTLRYQTGYATTIKANKVGQVHSKNLSDYPIDGVQADGSTNYWYVLVHGKVTWNVYSWDWETPEIVGDYVEITGNPLRKASDAFYFDETTGLYQYMSFALVDPVETPVSDLAGKWILSAVQDEYYDDTVEISNEITLINDVTTETFMGGDFGVFYDTIPDIYAIWKTGFVIETITADISKYPGEFVTANYWYVRSDLDDAAVEDDDGW